MPLVLPGSAIFLAFVMICLKAATVLTSGFGAFARTAMPRGTCARLTSVDISESLSRAKNLTHALQQSVERPFRLLAKLM